MPAHRPVEMSDDTSITAPSPKRLEGKVAIVTGGAKGIGQATVELFVKHGAVVVIADVDDVYGNSLAASLSPSVTYVHCDVSLEKDIQNLIDSTVSRYGKLDIMINNAGMLGDQSKYKSIVNFDGDEFENILRINVRGSALGMKHAARVMIPRSTGCIISTGSVAGVLGGCGPHAYTASKHAIVGLTKNAACELGKHGIRVNCISPSAAVTPMLLNAWRGSINVEEAAGSHTAARGPIHDEEVEKMEEFFRSVANLKGITLKTTDIAEAALYLASDESRYVSGHNLVVDGGFSTSKNVIDL